MLNSRFLYGALTGIAVASTGFYMYRKNKESVDAFLRSRGIRISPTTAENYAEMDLKELTMAKERIEDLIAEMAYAQKREEGGEEKKTAAD